MPAHVQLMIAVPKEMIGDQPESRSVSEDGPPVPVRQIPVVFSFDRVESMTRPPESHLPFAADRQ